MRVFIVLVLLTTLANAGRLRSDLLHSLKTSAKDLPGFEAKVNNFLEAAEDIDEHNEFIEPIISHGGSSPVPKGHAPGGHYEPDLSLHQYIHEDGHEAKVENIADMLATGTSEILLSMAEHHGVKDKLHELAHSSGHDLATSFIDLSHLEAHGLGHHELATIHAVSGAMNERIFEKLKRSSAAAEGKERKTSECPEKMDLDEGGTSLIADSVSSDVEDPEKMYTVEPSKPSNYDASAIEVPDPTLENKWHDLQTYIQSKDTLALTSELIDEFSDEESAKSRKLATLFSQSSEEEAKEVITSLTSGISLELGTDEENDNILTKLDEAAQSAGDVTKNGETLTEKLQRKIVEKIKIKNSKEGVRAVKIMLEGLVMLQNIAKTKINDKTPAG